MKKILYFVFFIVISPTVFTQSKQAYVFWKDDSLLKKSYYEQGEKSQNTLISSLDGKNKDEYKRIYKNRFEEVGAMLKSSRTVTAPEAHQYLQAILKKIVDANEVLKTLPVRMVFSRDDWPNAYSTGEGTLVVNAGLMVFLDNEAELVFVLCHELAHFYLNHSDNAIKKYVETVNSEEFKNEIKKLAKQEYHERKKNLEELVKKHAFGNRQHSRENEREADRQAFIFMKRTGYDCNGIKTCLQLLDKVDDSLLYKPVELEKLFAFPEYPFKKKWIQKQSSIFSQMKADDSPLTQEEKDSLQTHPDCFKRILWLEDSISKAGNGNRFLVNEQLFRQLKKEFRMEMAEQELREKNLTRNLYYYAQLLQDGEQADMAVYSIARNLNIFYESQKNHTLGLITVRESRFNREDYNLVLRMFDRVRLEEIAAIAYYFCSNYAKQMEGFPGFAEEFEKAKKNKNL